MCFLTDTHLQLITNQDFVYVVVNAGVVQMILSTVLYFICLPVLGAEGNLRYFDLPFFGRSNGILPPPLNNHNYRLTKQRGG